VLPFGRGSREARSTQAHNDVRVNAKPYAHFLGHRKTRGSGRTRPRDHWPLAAPGARTDQRREAREPRWTRLHEPAIRDRFDRWRIEVHGVPGRLRDE